MECHSRRVLVALAILTALAAPLRASADTALDLARQLNRAFVEVAEKVSPAVVVINVVQKSSAELQDGDQDKRFGSLPPGFWKEFHEQFGEPLPDTVRSEGSGIIIRENGYILTNRHVVEDAETIEVRLKDGRTFQGKVRGTDPQSDVAVVQIPATGLPVAKLADSDEASVGEFAIAIGAPFSLDYSVTFGHISAKSRSNLVLGSEGQSMDQDFIQTDANINPGNSGGPLVNINGEVIGINTLIRGLHTGIGFAIPSNLAREVADQLIANGRFARPWLGISIRSYREDPEFQQLIRGVADGVVVAGILPDGPAAKSDLKPTDVITAVNGKKVASAQQLRTEIRTKKIGEPLTLDVFRKGKTVRVKVIPQEWVQPELSMAKASTPEPPAQNSTHLGLSVQNLTRELAEQFKVDATEGVIVTTIEKKSPAAKKGIKPGDIITAVNQQEVNSSRQFQALLAKADPKQGVILNLISGNTARFEILKAQAP